MNNKLSALFAVGVLSLSLSGCVIHVGGDYDDADGAELSSVFGSIDVKRDRRVGDVSTVNGGIELDDNVVAESLGSVNGGIEMGDNVIIDSADVVNGDIEAGRNLHSMGSLETVNGDINLAEQALVEGNVETVNGDIDIQSGEIHRDIITVNGDIHIRGASVLHGDIVFERPNSDGWSWDESNVPKLTLDESVDLQGSIILERDVELNLTNPAHQGKVIRRFSEE